MQYKVNTYVVFVSLLTIPVRYVTKLICIALPTFVWPGYYWRKIVRQCCTVHVLLECVVLGRVLFVRKKLCWVGPLRKWVGSGGSNKLDPRPSVTRPRQILHETLSGNSELRFLHNRQRNGDTFRQVWSRYDDPLLSYSVFADNTLRDLVTLAFDLLTLNICHTWRVSWPTLQQCWKILYLLILELWVITSSFGHYWKCVRGHCACAESRYL